MVCKRGGRKRALGTRAPMAIPQEPNQHWSLDFVSDALACGRRFRMLNVIDDYSRECLAYIVDTSLSGRRVIRELSAIAKRRGLPCMVVSDNGTELTSHAVLAWCQDTGVEWHYIAPPLPARALNRLVSRQSRESPPRSDRHCLPEGNGGRAR